MKSTPEPGAAPGLADLRERALRLLARREHSRFELARKLGQAGFDIADITPLLDKFEQKNWLSDRRFAESYVADHLARSGPMKLAYELNQRGIADAVIDKVLHDSRDSELERAHAVWRKKFGMQPANAQERATQMRFLRGRGFSSEVINRVTTSKEKDF